MAGKAAGATAASAWQVTFGADGRATAVEVPAAERAEREPVPAELQVAPDPATLALDGDRCRAARDAP